MPPAHLGPLPGWTTKGGPPPAHIAGGGKTRAGTPAPPEQPCIAGQTRPHVPQLLLSVCRSTHVPVHAESPDPGKHDPAQPPAEQTWPAVHTTPQPPQLLGSLVGMHWPLQK